MGLEAPEVVTEPPPLEADDSFFLQALYDLIPEREGLGQIPWRAYAEYARYYRIDVDELRRVILPLDDKLREYQRAEHDRLRRQYRGR